MIRPLAQHCYDAVMMDTWPRPAALVDFGIDSDQHLGALQHAARNGATPQDFDDALGDGSKLNELVERFPGNPYPAKFATPYDTD